MRAGISIAGLRRGVSFWTCVKSLWGGIASLTSITTLDFLRVRCPREPAEAAQTHMYTCFCGSGIQPTSRGPQDIAPYPGSMSAFQSSSWQSPHRYFLNQAIEAIEDGRPLVSCLGVIVPVYYRQRRKRTRQDVEDDDDGPASRTPAAGSSAATAYEELANTPTDAQRAP